MTVFLNSPLKKRIKYFKTKNIIRSVVMKKLALVIGVFSLFSLFLMGCDDVLSLVTVDEKGEKVIHNYISLMGNTVYDTTVSLKNWKDIELLKDEDFSTEDLLVTIVSKKENIVVFGTADYAMEIKFFDAGYKYTVFMSAEAMSNSFK